MSKSEFHSWTSHFIWKHLFVVDFLSHHHRIDWSTWILNDVHCCRNRFHSFYMMFFDFLLNTSENMKKSFKNGVFASELETFFLERYILWQSLFLKTLLWWKSCGFHSSLNCQIQTDFPGKSGSIEGRGRGHENLNKVLVYITRLFLWRQFEDISVKSKVKMYVCTLSLHFDVNTLDR